jgi:hypothetical protein
MEWLYIGRKQRGVPMAIYQEMTGTEGSSRWSSQEEGIVVGGLAKGLV